MIRIWVWLFPTRTEYEEHARLQGYAQGFDAGRLMLRDSLRRIIEAETRAERDLLVVEAERRGWLAGAGVRGDGNGESK